MTMGPNNGFPVPSRSGLSGRFEEALSYAAGLHRDQVRKGTPIPYVSHLLSVAALVLEDGGDEDQAIAALLHDAVEDQGGAPRLDEIRLRFGGQVARIVEACTDSDETPKPPYRVRKQLYLDQLPGQPPDVLRVALADKLHNARGLLRGLRAEGPGELWTHFKASPEEKLWYLRAALEVFKAGFDSPMVGEFERVVGALETHAGVEPALDPTLGLVPSGWARVEGSYRVAVCQFQPALLATTANLATMEQMARQAAGEGAALIIFPECCVTGYGLGRIAYEMAALAEVAVGDDRGPAVRRMEALSAELSAGIVFGLVERSGGVVYNSAVTVLPGVGVAGVYHKSHMWEAEGTIFARGDGFSLMPGPAGRFGSLVCYDLEFPEASRTLALRGAQLVAVSTANMRPWEDFQRVYARARAMENNLFVAVANCIGSVGNTEFFGGSIITDPFGRVLAEAGGDEAVLVADIDLSVIPEAVAGLDYLAKRRPELYGGVS
jgi:predicted amidohydrolase